MSRRTIIAVACSVVFSGFLGGCADPRFKAAQTRRDQRVKTLIAERWAFDVAGPQRAKLYVDFLRRNEMRREGRLAADFGAIGKRYKRDADRWRDPGSPFAQWYVSHLPGHPERIPDAVARMVY